tara:strand:+ start:52 stop:327 length:276 start_codon:yes stop_codon:yes gene_type:complete
MPSTKILNRKVRKLTTREKEYLLAGFKIMTEIDSLEEIDETPEQEYIDEESQNFSVYDLLNEPIHRHEEVQKNLMDVFPKLAIIVDEGVNN